jgi:hypothetical protein
MGAMRISVLVLMCVLDQDLGVGNCPGYGMHLYSLIRLHTTNWVIICSLICNRNLTYNEGIRLDCYNMICATSELGMPIITLDRLFFMLSCCLAPTDVMSV